jgi:hypothetical protein
MINVFSIPFTTVAGIKYGKNEYLGFTFEIGQESVFVTAVQFLVRIGICPRKY